MWGVDYTTDLVKNLNPLYNGIEYCPSKNIPKENEISFPKEIKEKGLVTIAQIHTCGYPVKKYTVDEHFESFKEEVNYALK